MFQCDLILGHGGTSTLGNIGTSIPTAPVIPPQKAFGPSKPTRNSFLEGTWSLGPRACICSSTTYMKPAVLHRFSTQHIHPCPRCPTHVRAVARRVEQLRTWRKLDALKQKEAYERQVKEAERKKEMAPWRERPAPLPLRSRGGCGWRGG